MNRLVLPLLLAAATGCLSDDLPDAAWLPFDQLDPPFAPDVSLDAHQAMVGDSIRVVSFNVLLGADPENLARLLGEHPALSATDVFLIQEIEQHPDEPRSRTAALADGLAMNYAYAPARTLDESGEPATHGLAILSRFPLARVEVMRLPRFDILIRARDRIALGADVVVGGDVIRVVNVHLDTRLNFTQRLQQLHPAVIHSDGRLIIAGDFNTNPYVWASASVPLIPTTTVTDLDPPELLDEYMRGSGFDTPTSGSGPTQRAGIFDLRLDSIYTRELTVVDTGVERDVDVSDHVPLWVDVAPGD